MSDSPVKSINFGLDNKENAPGSTPAVDAIKKVDVEVVKPSAPEEPKKALTPKELEKEEPLLQENPHRFVLFPLKYHEVSRESTRDA